MLGIHSTKTCVKALRISQNGIVRIHSKELQTDRATTSRPGNPGPQQHTHLKQADTTTEEDLSSCHGITTMEPLKGSRWKWIWQSYALTLKPWRGPLKLIRCVLVRTLVLHDPAGSKAQHSRCSIRSYVLDTRRCSCWNLSRIRCDHKHHQWRIRMWLRLGNRQKSA